LTRAFPLICCAATVGILLLIVGRDYPLVGHDFAYFVPRLLDTDLHLRLNGLGVQWYTPSFGGGLPAFANPQHMQYSPLQALLFATTPWFAVAATIAIATGVGYWSMYLLLSQTLGLAPSASIIGAVGLAANGFSIEHAIVGHVGFLLFPLVSTMLHALTRPQGRPIENACVIALCAALMLHQGGALILVLCSGTLVLALQVLQVAGRPAINWASLVGILARALPLTIGLCASKIVAVQALMGRFPRELFDSYPIGFGHALFGLGSQLAGGLTILPILVAGGYLPQRLDDALIWATGAGVHLWEIDTALSPVVTLTLVSGAVLGGVRLWRHGLQRPSPAMAVAIAGLALMTWITIETTLAKGVLYPWLKSLPVLRSMHVNHRVAAVLILPLTIAAALLFDRWQRTARRSLVNLAVAIAVAAPLFYLTLPDYVHRRTFDVSASVRVHERIRAGETFPVLRNDLITDDRAIAENASSQLVYEPLFGYDNEYFTPKVREGAITLERDGALNLTNASSLLFPELNGLQPFDLIRATERDDLERFAARQQPHWKVPAMFGWLNAAAVATLAFCVGVLLASPIRRRDR